MATAAVEPDNDHGTARRPAILERARGLAIGALGGKRRRRSSETANVEGHARVTIGGRFGRQKWRIDPKEASESIREAAPTEAAQTADHVVASKLSGASFKEAVPLDLVAASHGKSEGVSVTAPSPKLRQVRRHRTRRSDHDFSSLHLNRQQQPHPAAFTRAHSRHHSTTSQPELTNRSLELDPAPPHSASTLKSSPSSGSDRSKELASSSTTSVESMEPPLLSLWGPDPIPLPGRFAKIKKNLIAGHEEELAASWARLIEALRAEVEHIECLGAHLIPSVEFADLGDPAQTSRFGRDLRRYGVGVVRKVVPQNDVDSSVRDTVQYLNGRRTGSSGQSGAETPDRAGELVRKANGLPHFPAPKQDPTCFDCFWTPAQIRCRAHRNVLRAQQFMMGLWEARQDGRISTHLPITYVDRLRVHGGGFDTPANGSGTPKAAATAGSESTLNFTWPRSQTPTPQAQPQTQPQHLAPQSADDWITALQSAAGIIAQVDNGSLERWEPDGYGRSQTYEKIFNGAWEDYDAWECAGRASSTMDLYNGYGACTIFRMFQGLLALSTIEPGMLRLLPSPKLATAYYLLRPFFNPKNPPPDSRSGPEWDAYLDSKNWELQRDPDTTIHGAVPGHAQRITERWHPHLYLRSSLVTLPTLQPGDYIFWHPDLPYHISSNSRQGLHTPGTPGADDVSMLVYIPAAPLTQTNALYLARQRKAFQRGQPGPDFDSGRGIIAEETDVEAGEKEIAELGGSGALKAMGLERWDTDEESSRRTRSQRQKAAISGNNSPRELDLVNIANLILFPD